LIYSANAALFEHPFTDLNVAPKRLDLEQNPLV